MALKTNREYELQVDELLQAPPLHRVYPMDPESWPKDSKPLPASALRASKHFQEERMADVDISQFKEFILSFKQLKLPNKHLLHREISRMVCDMADSADCLVNGFGGKDLLTYYITHSILPQHCFFMYADKDFNEQDMRFCVGDPFLKCISKLTGGKIKLEESVRAGDLIYNYVSHSKDVSGKSVSDYICGMGFDSGTGAC